MAKPLIEVENVSKSFESLKGGRVEAIKNLSLSVNKEEFATIVGRSGCGKSTLLRLIAGLIKPTSGCINIEGTKLEGTLPSAALVFQSPTLFPWLTVIQNILLPTKIKKLDEADPQRKADDLVKLVSMQGFEDKYPFELSGGMQQRVSIARALMCNPKILLMDEPFGALDALTREEMGLDLERIFEQQKVTTLFVTHDIAEAVFLSDNISVMSVRPGHIITNMKVSLARPRSSLGVKNSPLFNSHTLQIRQALGLVRDNDAIDEHA